ncbi:hypothetical protein FHR72_002919 [Mycolicibacterium iranicum]|uniref:Secreted protein n=1 Tax=Mycolicibacterium iranicum TaxID=912594 RepID=A0A839QAF2_MYCIR|nr:hypothetical protein [Mycolicibacterium iranicum]MBB2991435.1 hypothetical protein [Mycolicibacterium iranicum]
MSVTPWVQAAATAATGVALLLGGAASASAGPADESPDISFNPHPGGITATIQSWTRDPTNCTYTANSIRRDFFLPGHNGTVDNFAAAQARLEFPGVPLFRKWNVNVSCVNGKSVSTTYWY